MKVTIVLISVLIKSITGSCPDYCGTYNAQVCGFNGIEKKIFQNVCKMHVLNCRMIEKGEHTYNVLPQSECKKMMEEVKPVNTSGFTNLHICEKICTDRSSRSVCGEHGDGVEFERKFFRNQCEMAKTNCKTGTNYMVTFAYKCSNNDEMFPNSTAMITTTPEIDRNHCNSLCSSERKVSVCGSNGEEHRFFPNTCQMKIFNCKRPNGIKAFHPVYAYKCYQSLCSESCNDENLNPICAFNGNIFTIFDNKCKMKKANCEFNIQFQYKHVPYSLCGDGITSSSVNTSHHSEAKEPHISLSTTTVNSLLVTKDQDDTTTFSPLEVSTTSSADVNFSTTLKMSISGENKQEVCNRCRSLLNSNKCPSTPNPSMVWCWLCEQVIKECYM